MPEIYLIEDLRTEKWLKIGGPIEHSFLNGPLSDHWESKWTSDASEAVQWLNKQQAIDYRDRYLDLPGIEVTEHEFVNPKKDSI